MRTQTLQGILIACLASACGGDSPTSPTGQSESMTWTVNGQSFSASSNGKAAMRVGSGLSLTGGNCSAGAFVSMNVTMPSLSSGTYSIGSSGGSISWTPDARSGATANEAWSAPGLPRVVNNVLVSGGSGSVTISSISSDWVSGTFTGELIANPNNRDAAPKTIQGSFELSFKERTVC